MTLLIRLVTLAAVMAALGACSPPPYSSAHPDALRSGPFWEREEQRD
ncbi:MAG: hypothetical protein Tsb0032_08530 [Kiloniellaceae bacterium]